MSDDLFEILVGFGGTVLFVLAVGFLVFMPGTP